MGVETDGSEVGVLHEEAKRSIVRGVVKYVEEMILKECWEADKFGGYDPVSILDDNMTDHIG